MRPTAPLLAVLAAVAMSAASPAAAQNLRVVPVPYVATDLTIPHFAYNGHATTFKAIARGGNGTYLYEWDFHGDGVYDFAATTTNRYNLSTRYTYPNQAADTTFHARVRVTSGGQTVTGTYPVRVIAEVPANPSSANDRQLQVMRNVAIDDGLWFLHNQMSRSGNEEDPLTGAQITGSLAGAPTTAAAGAFLSALGMNGHFAAFPSAYLGDLPDPAANTQRWRDDPYAEDAARLVNYLLTQATIVAVPGQDEVNVTGFYPEFTATPIAGTDDGIGIFIGSGPGNQWNGYHSAALIGLARANLAGYVAQVGDASRILGRRFEFVVQQMVDALVWSQNDGGSYPGSWYYTPNANVDLLGEFGGGGVLEAAEALIVAERLMGGHGVVVPNLAKARLASFIQQNVNSCPGAGLGAGPLYGGSWGTSANGVCDHALTAAHVVTYGWVGANQFSGTDARLAFPSYYGITRGQLRGLYDGTLNFIGGPQFAASNSTHIGWDTGFVDGGDFNRVDGRGNHWGMLHWTRAARAVEPEIVNFGNNNAPRLFASYLVRNQASDGGWNWTYGSTSPNNDNNVGAGMRAAWALEVLSREGLAPFAIGSVSQSTAPEGTPIDFNGMASVGEGGSYVWAFGNGATAEGRNVTYAYPDNGMFNATLTITAPGGTSVATVQVTITNVAPAANAGPDKSVDEGTALPLGGTFTDPGSGDTWMYQWSFGDGTTSNAQNVNKTWADDGVYDVSFRVTDDDGGTSQDVTVVTVRNVAPSITSTPATSATEGTAFTYTLTFTDPGPGDTHVCTAPVKPASAVLAGCAVSWTPAFPELAPGAFTLCVADDDGASTCQPFTVAVSFLDTDGDGLPDSWETNLFGGTAAQDQFGDPDQDGQNNLQEFLAGSDPTQFVGPGAPAPLEPSCGSKVTTAQPTLSVGNALDPREVPLSYDFEVYGEAGMTTLVADGLAVLAGEGYTTWTLDAPLAEDHEYFWRARAGDGVIFGPWTPAGCSFVVNAVPNTLSITDGAVGSACDTFGNGGQRTRTGLDDGSGGGTADDGILQAGEVDSTTIVCNGANGADGTNGADGATGPAGANGESGGCGSAPGGVASWPALLVLGALALRRGRRERGSPRPGAGDV